LVNSLLAEELYEMKARKDIFFSYSHLDAEIATELASRLYDQGLTCFVAERDITATQQWESRIRDEILGSKCVLVLLTPRSKDSTWVKIETGAAWVLKKDIVPATMFVDACELPEPLNRYQLRKVETNSQVVTLIQELQKSLKNKDGEPEEKELPDNMQLGKTEIFNERGSWDRLQKIGDWQFDEGSKVLSAEGVNKYLLSHFSYGDKPFQVSARLKFSNLEPTNHIPATNSGIVFGWKSTGNTMRYFNLLLTGKKLLLELIGQKGGSVFQDYRHLDEGRDFEIIPGKYFELCLQVRDRTLNVKLNGEEFYQVNFEDDPIGRVGIRPWRNMVESDLFEISEL